MGEARMSELTARRRQIVAVLAQGMSNKEIARMLGISDGTVKVHLHQIFERLAGEADCALHHLRANLQRGITHEPHPTVFSLRQMPACDACGHLAA
jgi:FixJ family two-component response regulator